MTFNAVVAAFAAIAGVGFTGWQTFGPSGPPPAINVTVAAPTPPPAQETVAAKSDAPVQLLQPANFTAALNDGSEKTYAFGKLFDGDPATSLTITAPDRELNILASFAAAQTITGLEYTPPQGAALANAIDVMILPDGRMEPSGRQVLSFALQTTPGRQTLLLPASERGKALWIRIAGPDGSEAAAVGDFKVLSAP